MLPTRPRWAGMVDETGFPAGAATSAAARGRRPSTKDFPAARPQGLPPRLRQQLRAGFPAGAATRQDCTGRFAQDSGLPRGRGDKDIHVVAAQGGADAS